MKSGTCIGRPQAGTLGASEAQENFDPPHPSWPNSGLRLQAFLPELNASYVSAASYMLGPISHRETGIRSQCLLISSVHAVNPECPAVLLSKHL